MNSPYVSPQSLSRPQLSAAVAAVIHRLPEQHVPILKARLRIEMPSQSIVKTMAALGVTRTAVRQAEARAMAMLTHPAQQELVQSLLVHSPDTRALHIDVQQAVEKIRQLTPDLILHLQRNSNDLVSVRWEVFEHLIAELLVSSGFQDVSLIGRDPGSAADVFAAWKVGPLGTSIRYFVEVKRWKDRIGVEVIDHVYGAMLAERATFGWHAALIVSVVGFSDFRKYTRPMLKNMGIELKTKDDVMRWLEDYKPDSNGLWLPQPRKGLPPQHAA